MRSTVKKWGNSAAVRIPASVMESLGLSVDEEVDVRQEAGRIVIIPILPRAYDLGDLLSRITPENQHATVDFGPPVGKEAL